MKQLSVIAAFVSLCLVLADGFPVSDDRSPKIIGPAQIQIKAHPGELLILHCNAFTNCEDDVTLIYWLVNDTFPEDTASSERIIELEESTAENGAILQKNLLLKKVTPEDLKTTFTCVVTNTAGAAHKSVMLTAKTSDSKGHKRNRAHICRGVKK